MKAVVGNLYTTLSEAPQELEELLTVAYPNYWFSPRFRNHLWDGKCHFLTISGAGMKIRIPSGLLFVVQEYCQSNELELCVVYDCPTPSCLYYPEPDIPPDILAGVMLRDNQRDAISTALTQQRGVLEMPTGSGKSECAAGIIRMLGTKTKSLFLVHTTDLLHQTADRFRQRLGSSGFTVGMFGDGIYEDGDVIVATVQTLYSNMKKYRTNVLKWLAEFRAVFIDECHHSSSTEFFSIGMNTPNAAYRIGLSGTAMRRDILANMRMMAVLGPPIYHITTRQLINEGHLCDIRITILDNPSTPITSGTYHNIYDQAIVHSITRNELIISTAVKEFQQGRRVLVLVRLLEHGEILKTMLESHSIKTIFIRGKDSSLYRKEIRETFGTSQEDEKFILIASTIFSEGVDLPEISALIIASGGTSETQTIQRVGRGLRKKSDGSDLVVYDIKDRDKFLLKHANHRINVYKEEELLDVSANA